MLTCRRAFLNFTRTTCGLPAEDHRQEVRVVTLTMFALATIFFIIRMIVKYLRFTPWGVDDTWLAIGFVRLKWVPCRLAKPVMIMEVDSVTDAYDPLDMPHPIQ